MEAVWSFRLMLFIALALIMFGDFFGYGSIRVVKSASGTSKSDASTSATAATTSEFNNHHHPNIEVNEDTSSRELSSMKVENENHLWKYEKARKLSEAIREACLPKMLCEMASRPELARTDKEKNLLHLIKSTSISLAMNSPPNRWHFAAQMGELLRHTSDSLSGPMGCANLWPQCPFSSKKLMSLTYKVNLK